MRKWARGGVCVVWDVGDVDVDVDVDVDMNVTLVAFGGAFGAGF